MAGVRVPLVAMHHAYVVTERIEGIQVGIVFCVYLGIFLGSTLLSAAPESLNAH